MRDDRVGGDRVRGVSSMIDNKIEPKNILIYGAGAIGSLMEIGRAHV